MENDSRRARGHFTVDIGTIPVTAISDGILNSPQESFTDEAGVATRFRGLDVIPIQVNCFLLRHEGLNILFDAGCGDALQPGGTRMAENLVETGLRPGQIDIVVMTHLHIDHTGGLLRGGSALFPSASIMVPAPEYSYWFQEDFPALAPSAQKRSAEVASSVRAAYEGRLKLFEPGAVILPGVRSVPLPGHTPGHTGFHIFDGGESLFLWGDIVHSVALQMTHPDVAHRGDADAGEARAIRIALLKECAADARLVAGMHLPFPGIGRIVLSGSGYDFVPLGR